MPAKQAFPKAKSDNVFGQARKPAKMFRAGLYARVSTKDQTLETQLEQLKQAGAIKIFAEKKSGSEVTPRKELGRVLKALKPGDLLVITRLDRLARSTRDLLNLLDQIGKAGADFKSLKDTWADTTTPHGRLMLTILAGLAEFERELIRERTAEGRQRAKEAGIHLGRPSKLNRYQIAQARRLQAEGISNSEIGKLLGVSHQTIGRI